MPTTLPSVRVLANAARRRLWGMVGLAQERSDTTSGLALSPSERHFSDYQRAPLKLRFASHTGGVAAWQNEARAKLAELVGYGRPSASVQTTRPEIFPLPNGFVRRRFYLKARDGVDIPVHLVAPSTPSPDAPVMICLQGTNSGAHLSWGEKRYPADVDVKLREYDFAIQAAQRGYLAVAIEQACFGERTERRIDPRSSAPCVDATMHAILLGRSLLGERCSDVSAVVGWLIEQAGPLGIEPDRIFMMGHSAGGSVALFSTALDERTAGVMACGCLGSIRDTIGRRRDNQGQNVIPGILNWMEMADVVALIAPRPFVSVAGTSDHIWPSAGALGVAEEARAAYASYGAETALLAVEAEGEHRFRPQLSWDAWAKALSYSQRQPRPAGPQLALRS